MKHKRWRKLASLVATSAILFGSFQPPVFADSTTSGSQQTQADADSGKKSSSNPLEGMLNNPAALSAVMTMGFGGIPLPGSSAKYMPMPSKQFHIVPMCYINPKKPEKGQNVTVVCFVAPPKGVSVVRSSPPSIVNMLFRKSPIVVQQVTMDDDTQSLYFSWDFEKQTTNADGKPGAPIEDSASVSLTIAAYEGDSGLSGDDGIANNSGDVELSGEGVTRECNADNTMCYVTTCTPNGSCTKTCEGSACPSDSSTEDSKCSIGYSYSNGYCVLNLNESDDCDSGYAKNDAGVCEKTTTDTTCTSINGESYCQDCLGDICVPYSPSDCVTGTICNTTDNSSGGDGYTYPTDDGGYYDSGSSSLDDAANDALNNLFGDDDTSYNAPEGDWLDSEDPTGDMDTLDGYLGDGAEDMPGDGAVDDMTTDDSYYVDPGADSADGYDGSGYASTDGSNGADGDGSNGADGSNGSNGSNGADGSLGSLLGRYKDGTSGLDALLNGDNSELLGKIDGKNSSLSDKIGALLGLGNDTNVSPTKSNNELYDIARQTLLANGMTMDDIMHGRNYDANSAFTEPKTAWDMNRITTLINSKKLKVDSKGNAVDSASASKNGKSSSSGASSSSSSGSKQSSSSSSGAKNASLTK